MCILFWFGYTRGMRRIAVTLAVVVALLFSAGSAWADFDDGVAAYERGDYETAFREFLPLAEQGHAISQAKLGFMYTKGTGVPQNYIEAVKWFRKAAEQGEADAQSNLGRMYARGDGVSQDRVTAYMWCSLAEAQGHKKAARDLNFARRTMTPAQIAKAQALATEWREKHNN